MSGLLAHGAFDNRLLAVGTFDTIANLLKTLDPSWPSALDKLYLLDTGGWRRSSSGTNFPTSTRSPSSCVACGRRSPTQEVVEAMTTNESLFFRDEKPFAHVPPRAALP